MKGTKYTLVVELDKVIYISPKDFKMSKNEDHSVVSTLINNILKKAFYETKYR
jgi:hypothetical protein